ncbi:hypothetical protein AB833_04665 [Chromatiales bacterium (ex Bugula neritina AB1)]|nr:hypothetical protein AB833_04665 [Chromatiales bacterium (ex Bugula neritina AB1)]
MKRRHCLKLMAGCAMIPLLPFTESYANNRASTSRKRLILLELSGANDGLNTVVPYSDDRYYELRPSIGLGPDRLIKLNNNFALNASLKQAMPLWESAQLAIVHGLGYPSPNRSHFKSIALWETGGDGNVAGRHGWATHDLEHAYASSHVDAHGIVLGGGMGIFSSPGGNWLSMSAADQFSNRRVVANHTHKAVNDTMALLLDRAKVLKSSLDNISRKVALNKKRVQIHGGDLSDQMTHAVNIINSGINVPVIKLSLNGFDTHDQQTYKHQSLLSQVARAISGMRRELIKSGEWNNTVLLTYSEFGRRARENKSHGTDHGTAAAHFLCGGRINGGMYGTAPDLGQLIDDDLQHTMDYRAVYSRLLNDWLELPSNSFAKFTDDRLNHLIS